MRRAQPLVRQLLAAGEAAQSAGGVRQLSTSGNFSFASLQDAPAPAGSSAVKVNVTAKPGAKPRVQVAVTAGSASARAEYDPTEVRKVQQVPLQLYDTPRISVLHSSFQEYLLRAMHDRYQILAQWPDFSSMYGKDYYHRAHPEEVRKFYQLVDEFHRMYDVVTEFDALSYLATQLVPTYRKRRLNVLHPGVGPALADGVATQFLLAQGSK